MTRHDNGSPWAWAIYPTHVATLTVTSIAMVVYGLWWWCLPLGACICSTAVMWRRDQIHRETTAALRRINRQLSYEHEQTQRALVRERPWRQ